MHPIDDSSRIRESPTAKGWLCSIHRSGGLRLFATHFGSSVPKLSSFVHEYIANMTRDAMSEIRCLEAVIGM